MFNAHVLDDMVHKWNKCYKFDFGIMLRHSDFFLLNIKVIIIENFISIIYIWFKKKHTIELVNTNFSLVAYLGSPTLLKCLALKRCIWVYMHIELTLQLLIMNGESRAGWFDILLQFFMPKETRKYTHTCTCI